MAVFFNTPENEVSFSSIVDAVARQSGLPHQLLDIIAAVNSTIREIQGEKFLYPDLIEDQITVTAEPHIYQLPRGFRRFTALEYPGPIKPKLLRPNRMKDREFHKQYYYLANGNAVFAGNGGVGTLINIAYYKFDSSYNYYKRNGLSDDLFPNNSYSVRPAYFDTNEDVWYYWDGTTYVTDLSNDTTEESYRNLTANWLIKDWGYAITAGALAKMLANINEQRAKQNFSVYKSAQNVITREFAKESTVE